MCGDCTDAAAVSAVLAGIVPHLMVTDPPYGVIRRPRASRTYRRPGLPLWALLLNNPYAVFRNRDRQDGKRDRKGRLLEDGHTENRSYGRHTSRFLLFENYLISNATIR